MVDEVFTSSPDPCSPVWFLLRRNRKTARGSGPGLRGHLSSTDGDICPHWPHFMMANQASFFTLLHNIKCWTHLHFLSATNLLREKWTLPFPPLITNQAIWNLVIGPVALSSSRLLLFSCSGMSTSLKRYGLEHARLPCPSPSPRVCSNSCPFSRWYHPTISSSVNPFSSCPQSFTSGSFSRSHLFASDEQNFEVSASAPVLPVNIQGCFPLGLTGLISLLSEGLSGVFSSTLKCVCKIFHLQWCFLINHQGYGSHVLSFLFLGSFSAFC